MKKNKVTKAKITPKKTPEDLLKSGELIAMPANMSEKVGIAVCVALPKADYAALNMAEKIKAEKGKAAHAFLNAVMCTIARCQRTNVHQDAVVRLDAVDCPPLAMSIHPMSLTDLKPVVIVMIFKEDKPNGKHPV